MNEELKESPPSFFHVFHIVAPWILTALACVALWKIGMRAIDFVINLF